MAFQLKAPTEAQNASYLRCLQIDARVFHERMKGQSGLLTADLRAEHEAHAAVVSAALNDGVGFDRMAFGDVLPA